MNIISCIKAVRSDLVFQDNTDHGEYVINPYDLLAFQKLIELKKINDTTISCISMGPNKIKDALVKCLALGADEVYWLNDITFAGSDTVATTYILSEGIKKIKHFDLIVCGAKAVDGETGQVVIGLAKRLGLPCVIDVEEILECEKDYIIVQVDNDRFRDVIKIQLPAVIVFKGFTTITEKISLMGLKRANRKPIHTWTLNDLNLDNTLCGVKGSKTKVISIETNLIKKKGCLIDGDSKEKSNQLNQMLMKAIRGG